MDNTLVDELGSTVRPGMRHLLEKLIKDGHTLIIWSYSEKQRGRYLLRINDLEKYFTKFIFREDYDAEGYGNMKDITKVNGDILIDDDRREIEYVRSIRKHGFLITPYRKFSRLPEGELESLEDFIKKKSGSLVSRLLRRGSL